ncbi:MAG TPA: helix-turn-helix domain-containing protein [Hyphomicrobiaceae bacterium]|nr:helix-turn-helix domain-containing protein [Hyphomicrobiaceae bacterium]
MPAASQPPPIRAAFARRLRELRIPRGFKTARMFAKALGIDENRYTRYERAEVEPDLTMLMRICSTLEISPNELFGVSGLSQMAIPGFGESPRNEELAATPTAGRSHGEPAKAASAADRRQALAWQLARELAQLEAKAEPARRGSALQTVQRVSRLYYEIEANPFAFVAKRVEMPPVTTLEPKAQAKVIALMESLIEAVNKSTLG